MRVDQIVYGYVAKEEVYADKTNIIEEGSSGEWLYVILEGQVKVRKRASKGLVTIETLETGEIFGEMALLEPGTPERSAYIEADGPVRVGVLETERLIKDYETVSPRLKGLISSLVRRLKKTTEQAVELAAGNQS